MNLPCAFLSDTSSAFQPGTIHDIQLIPAMDCAEGVYVFLVSDREGMLHRIKGHQHINIKTDTETNNTEK